MAKIANLDEGSKNSKASSVVKVFENTEFGKVRAMMIGEEPWFVGNDVANILGYKIPKDAIKVHVLEKDKMLVQLSDIQQGGDSPLPDNAKNSKIIIINESGLYRLILRSNLPSADIFSDWVTSEVLPSIRKTGSYSIFKKEIMEPSNYVEQVEGLTAWVKAVSGILNLNDASKVSYLEKAGRPLNLPVPDYVPSMGVVKSATELLKENSVPLSAIAFNRIAMNKGALVELSRKSSHGYKRFKNIAADWLEFGENQVNPNNPKETQPLWYKDRFPELLKKLEIL